MTMKAKLKPFHPLADVLPLIEGAEFDRLVDDIREHGLLNPITVYDDMVLDGRNRERACRKAGVDPVYVPFTGDNPVAFVLSQNLERRHLDHHQRAWVAARLATLQQGRPRKTGKIAALPTQEQAAKLVGVSERLVRGAKAVLEQGTPELQEAVAHGRLAIHHAEKAARLPAEDQSDLLAAVAAGKEPSAWQNNYGRKTRATALAETTRALPEGEKRWPVILADPPWDFHAWNPDSAANSHPARHYPLMSLEEICALPVPDLAAKDCILFLWTTGPCLEEAFAVLKAWGFQYKSQFVWDKERPGTGFWTRGQHELLLIAIKGNPPLPPQEAVPPSVIRERRREHSRKPEASYAIIEAMYPDLPKLELFARQRRKGWEAWGNEVPSNEASPHPLDIPARLRRTAS